MLPCAMARNASWTGYRIVNVNACGVGPGDPASVASYSTGRKVREAQNMEHVRGAPYHPMKGGHSDRKGEGGSIDNCQSPLAPSPAA
jgi:hypothetical protein